MFFSVSSSTSKFFFASSVIFFFVFSLFASFGSIVPSSEPTSTVLPLSYFISDNIPFTGEGTSILTLSVSNSTKASSTSISSPTFFNHFDTVASVMLSPNIGTTIFSLINY